VTLRTSYNQTRSSYQRPKEFPHRNIKAVGSFLQDAIGVIQAVSVLSPEQAVHDRFMDVECALR